jgi:hypothetical protein
MDQDLHNGREIYATREYRVIVRVAWKGTSIKPVDFSPLRIGMEM